MFANEMSTFWEAITAISSAITVIIAFWGLYFIRETYKQTVIAVKTADRAVDSSNKAVEITSEIGSLQIRPWIYIKDIDLISLDVHEQDNRTYLSISVSIKISNSGQTPALNIANHLKGQLSGIKINGLYRHQYDEKDIEKLIEEYEERKILINDDLCISPNSTIIVYDTFDVLIPSGHKFYDDNVDISLGVTSLYRGQIKNNVWVSLSTYDCLIDLSIDCADANFDSTLVFSSMT